MLGQSATVIVAVTVILCVLAIVAVALRLYCRRLQKLPLGGDDYCVVTALVLSIGISTLTDYVASTTGIGDPSYVPSMDAAIFALKVNQYLGLIVLKYSADFIQANFAAENAQIAAMGFVKVSLLLFYRRIFVTRWFLIGSNVLIGLITSFTLAIMLSIIFSKWPVSGQWDPMVPYNINASADLVAFVVGNTVFDLLTLSLPLAALRNLQMNSHRKLVLSTIFSLGSLCIITSLFRLYYAVQFTKTPLTPNSLFEGTSQPFHLESILTAAAPFIYNSLWANIEPPVFILTGCFLTFGPLYRTNSGPRSLFRSLRSRILKMSSRSSSRSPAQGDSARENMKHGWEALHEARKDGSAGGATFRAQWELTDVSTVDEAERTRRLSEAMV